MIALRGAFALGCALLAWQNTYERGDTVDAAPQRFATARTITTNAPGQACAVLDASVFTGTRGELGAMRLYRDGGAEVPFAVTESGEAGQREEAADVRNLGQRDGRIVFDLAMPARAYTTVTLALAAQDFYAVADVSGLTSPGAAGVKLGTFALFDLKAQGLARNTTLSLQEETFPLLHIELKLQPSPGAQLPFFPASIVTGATVPPTRSAQMAYTTVAATGAFHADGKTSIAEVRVPSHVPVERVTLALSGADTREFLRPVVIRAKTEAAEALTEEAEGEIERVHRSGVGGTPVESENLSVSAIMAANLRDAATVQVVVQNGDDAPLPLAGATLAMRERKICFNADAGTTYTLMYGAKATVRAPVYDFARLFDTARLTQHAALGPERGNTAFRVETVQLTYLQRHPEMLWVALLAAVGVLGAVALRGARKAA